MKNGQKRVFQFCSKNWFKKLVVITVLEGLNPQLMSISTIEVIYQMVSSCMEMICTSSTGETLPSERKMGSFAIISGQNSTGQLK